MAGDWIKMRTDLYDDPAVIAMAVALGLDEDTIVGKLGRIWSWADKHTIDGTTSGVNSAWVDRFLGCKGFAQAMCEVEWLCLTETSITFPGFEKHNGKSAKSRCEASVRQRLSRKNRDEGVTGPERTSTPAPFVRSVLSRDDHRCVYCGEQENRTASLKRDIVKHGVDHIIPLKRGGKDAVENLVTCCKRCNNEKNDRTPEEWGNLPTFLQDGVTYMSQKICDISVTREEKRREEERRGSSKDSKPKPSRKYSSAFERWWSVYPLKVSKLEASKAYVRAGKRIMEIDEITRDMAVEKLQNACIAFSQSDAGQGSYCPHAATWLNQGRYDDDPAAWKERAPATAIRPALDLGDDV